jgi:hypothetical protein
MSLNILNMATPLQEKAVLKTLENLGSDNTKSRGEILREVGYSESVSINPQIVTESKGFKELLEEHLSDETLSQAHKELLNQKRIEYFTFPKKMSDDEVLEKVTAAGLTLIVIQEGEKGKYAFYSMPDANAKKAALEMAYKLKGSFAPEKSIRVNVDIEVSEEDKLLATKLRELERDNTTDDS